MLSRGCPQAEPSVPAMRRSGSAGSGEQQAILTVPYEAPLRDGRTPCHGEPLATKAFGRRTSARPIRKPEFSLIPPWPVPFGLPGDPGVFEPCAVDVVLRVCRSEVSRSWVVLLAHALPV